MTVEQLKAIEKDTRSNIRAFGVATAETPDGDPIAGLSYTTDYRAEEEWGVAELRNAITGDNPRNFKMIDEAKDHIAFFEDARGIAISTNRLPKRMLKWNEDPENPDLAPGKHGHEHSSYFDFAKQYHGYSGAQKYRYMTVAELRDEARKLGIKPLSKTKDELFRAVTEHDDAVETDEHWPGSFRSGKTLVLRADGDGVTARVLDKLIDAAENGTLGMGDASGPFKHGLFFYDTRDETPGLIKQINDQHDWYDAHYAKAQPIEKELNDAGINISLTNFTEKEREDGSTEVEFFVNPHFKFGHTERGKKLNYGWFILDQIKNKEFISDAE